MTDPMTIDGIEHTRGRVCPECSPKPCPICAWGMVHEQAVYDAMLYRCDTCGGVWNMFPAPKKVRQ